MIIKIITCGIFLAAINATDIKGYKIKNKFVLPMVIVGLIIGLISKTFSDSIYGMLIPLVLFPLYAVKMLGAGDIKAMCAIGAAVGLHKSIETMIFTFLCGGVIAVVFMSVNKNGKERFKNLFCWFKSCFYIRKPVSYNFGGTGKNYFRFSYAITLGFVCMIINNYCNFIKI